MLIIIYLTLSSLILDQTKTVDPIVNIEDIEQYLNAKKQKEKSIKKLLDEKQFWTKKSFGQKGAYIYDYKLAKVSEKLFEVTGAPIYLEDADHYYSEASSKTSGKYKAAVLLSQSSNSIKQHEFQKAYKYCQESFKHTNDNIAPSYMTFDAAMELGKFNYAQNILNQFKNENSFDYLVRDAKYQDHVGNLEGAIVQMEKALSFSKNTPDQNHLWALTNLGDMYGHDGRIQLSYDTYLKALEIDPENLHVLKGISWISYAHDHNTELSQRIIQHVSEANNLPDAHLILAELSQFQNDVDSKNKHIENFLSIASQPEYSNMYATYLLEIYLESETDFDKAFAIAKEEVNKRPTPETFANLALVMHTMGKHTLAEAIILEKVEGQSFEPNLISICGTILSEAGCFERSEKLLKEALEAAFELGPVKTIKIEETLKELENKQSPRIFNI